MLILSLDTTTRAGSIALWQDHDVVEVRQGDPAVTHGVRLPGELIGLLEAHGKSMRQVDVYSVCAGPGSFTGLRVGLATVQGLALVNDRSVVAVPALEAIAYGVSFGAAGLDVEPDLILSVMDGQRGEVFAALYAPPGVAERDLVTAPVPLAGPIAAPADRVAAAWEDLVTDRSVAAAGDGVSLVAEPFKRLIGSRLACGAALPLAPVMARVAAARADRGLAVRPHAVQPIYVRRPDAVLARDRRRSSP
jgi:tRNA threonylcarbamoyladenosine biosynthesis protein TsaB